MCVIAQDTYKIYLGVCVNREFVRGLVLIRGGWSDLRLREIASPKFAFPARVCLVPNCHVVVPLLLPSPPKKSLVDFQHLKFHAKEFFIGNILAILFVIGISGAFSEI